MLIDKDKYPTCGHGCSSAVLVKPEGVWPYCGQFKLHEQFWPLERIGNCMSLDSNCEPCILSVQVSVGIVMK